MQQGCKGKRGEGSKSPHSKDLSPTLSFPLSVGVANSWPQACLLLLQVIYLLVSSHINPGFWQHLSADQFCFVKAPSSPCVPPTKCGNASSFQKASQRSQRSLFTPQTATRRAYGAVAGVLLICAAGGHKAAAATAVVAATSHT